MRITASEDGFMTAIPDNLPEHLNAALILSDGAVFFGQGVGKPGVTYGEICFNTGLTGYQEIITDLSYAGQIITFTFPHIGNVGANDEDMESLKPAAQGVILREPIFSPSNFRNESDLNSWLKHKNITGISGIDTRRLTILTREQGPQNVAICYGDFSVISEVQATLKNMPPMKGRELTRSVTCNKADNWNQSLWELGKGFNHKNGGKCKVVAIDYGAKLNILRCLVEVGCEVIVVPADTSAKAILAHNPDGIFLSNGPGDPAATAEFAVPVIQELLAESLPIFGICMGHQLLATALGCKTYKMQRGHRGSNQPVKDLQTGKVEITSQNHGFVVDKDQLPEGVELSHISLFDGSCEGIRLKDKPVFSVQHHPEASPGPHDSYYLFQRFVEVMQAHA